MIARVMLDSTYNAYQRSFASSQAGYSQSYRLHAQSFLCDNKRSSASKAHQDTANDMHQALIIDGIV